MAIILLNQMKNNTIDIASLSFKKDIVVLKSYNLVSL